MNRAWYINRIAEYRLEGSVWENGRLRIAARREVCTHPQQEHPIDSARALLAELNYYKEL